MTKVALHIELLTYSVGVAFVTRNQHFPILETNTLSWGIRQVQVAASQIHSNHSRSDASVLISSAVC